MLLVPVANGAELVEPLIDAAFNDLPEKSRSVLFQRMLTIVYIAQELEIKKATEPVPIDRPALLWMGWPMGQNGL
jgi:hypothetical protein